MQQVIESLKNNRSQGLDSIPSEFIKLCKHELNGMITLVLSYVIEYREFPDRSAEGIRTRVFKNGRVDAGLNNSIGPIARNCPKWPSGNHICGPKLPAKLSFWKFGQQTFSCVKQLLIAHPMCSLILRGVLESNSFGFESTFVHCLNDRIFIVFDLIIWSVNYWTLIWIISEICKWDCSISNGYQ